MKRLTKNSTAEKDLLELKTRLASSGQESLFLETVLKHRSLHHQFTQYLWWYGACKKCGEYPFFHNNKKHNFIQRDRIYPSFLPTQVSGRWSVTNPPKITENKEFRDSIVKPDVGHSWICWDLDAIEAKLVAAYADDETDLGIFENGWDIHTITACKMLNLEQPPNLVDPHTSYECLEWRAKLNWKGKEDERRILAKSRYAVLYGFDEKAVEGSTYENEMVKQGFSRTKLKQAARLFLQLKPGLVACKNKWFEECARTKVARTIFGRKRILYGNWETRAKDGWNHMIQGTVSDILNIALIEIDQKVPDAILLWPSHDAAKHQILTSRVEEVLPVFKNAVEKTLIVNGHKIKTTATWYIRHV